VAVSPDPTGLTPGQAVTPASEPQPTPAPSPDAGGAPEPAPQDPAAIEAIWQNRFSQRDRAHNAEVESLRAQLAEARGVSVPAPANGEPGATPTQAESYKARYEAAQQELSQERARRTVSERRAMFPALAAELSPEDPTWAQANEESLARLNALVGAPAKPAPTGHVDPNNPARTPPAPAKDLSMMSKQELLDELKRLSPAEEAARQLLR